MSCPCRSKLPLAECCGRYLGGGAAAEAQAAAAPTAEALMRSRFTAYAIGDADYVLRTWHPTTAPATLDLDDDVTWVSLQIVETSAGGVGDDVGTVHFRASFRTPSGRDVMEETSRFSRVDGEWRYLDGDVRG